MVFTSGVLIHINPCDIYDVIDEIVRISKKYVWCFEYYNKENTMIKYRGHNGKLWKNDFLKIFLKRHPNLKVVNQKKVKYREGNNENMMFLLEKK